MPQAMQVANVLEHHTAAKPLGQAVTGLLSPMTSN